MKYALAVLFLVCACYAKPSTRIIGGHAARAAQFPFAAAIYATRSDGTYFCSGALFNNQWIVSAAQCVQNATLFRVRLGSNHLDGTDPNVQIFSTDTWFVHPEYDPFTQNNDIGLIRLRQPITYTQYLRAINLPRLGLSNDAPVVALGWGQLSDEDAGLTNDLHYVELTTISNPECRLFYGEQITNTMICAAGNFNEGTCIGDSGGALIEQRGGLYLVGISSFLSFNGCESTDPSGFVRVYSFVPWINEVTSSFDSNN